KGANVMPETYSDDQVKALMGAMDFSWALGLAPEAKLVHDGNVQHFVESLNNREQAIYKSGIFGQDASNLSQVRRDKLRGSQLEAMMVNTDIMAMGADKPGTDWTSLSDAEKLRV